MSAASFRNLGAAVRERDRRTALSLDSPGTAGAAQAGYLMPEWDALYGSLREGADAQGKGYALAGGGMPAQDTSTTRPGDEDIARTLQINSYLGKLTDQQRMQAEAQKQMEAQTTLAQTAAATAAADAAQRGQMDRSLVSPDAPSTTTRDLGVGPRAADTITVRSAPQTDRERLLASVPGHLRPQIEMQLAAADEKRAALDEAHRHNVATEPSVDAVLSPEAVDQNARVFLKTGVMPVLGQKDPNNRQRIANRAAELSKDGGGDIAANKADYKADSGSLASMQKQRDAIGAFEETAGKNIDIFLDAAGKVVDSGSPLANTPLRAVTGKLLGSPDQAKYDAARQVAINEIAKITSNPTLSGQLSDSARHEVEAFNPSGATLAQTVAVMRLLKQDMGNRVGSLDEQLKTIKGRIAAAPPAPKGFVDLVSPDGRPLHVPEADVDRLLKAGATRKQ